MTPRLLSLLPVVALGALHFACQPQIGDDCRTSVDCSQSGDRLCDITQPGGYCTVFNCEIDTCPEDSACIAFDAQVSSEGECRDDNGVSRFTRSFCMANCDGKGDCRAGYVCEDMKQSNNRLNALAVDKGRSGKVCVRAPASSTEVPPPKHLTEVCTGAGAGGAAGDG